MHRLQHGDCPRAHQRTGCLPRRLAAAALFVLRLAPADVAAGQAPDSGTAGCGVEPDASWPWAAGQTVPLQVSFDGDARTGLLHVPRSYRASVPAPLVLAFHGYGAAGESMVRTFRAMSEAEGFVLLAFDGEAEGVTRSWNGGGTTGSPGPDGPTCAAWTEPVPCYPSCEQTIGWPSRGR
jgi:poly(3-hydroxybutyrate) depolymerase